MWCKVEVFLPDRYYLCADIACLFDDSFTNFLSTTLCYSCNFYISKLVETWNDFMRILKFIKIRWSRPRNFRAFQNLS